jgi:hypothetical protein
MSEIKQFVLSVLRSGGVDKIKPFTAYGQSIFPIYYKSLAARLSMFDSIQVVQTTDGNVEYIPADNKMIIGFPPTHEPHKKALVIHEATHAVCDMIKMPVNNDVGEVLAYVAQCQYYKANAGNIDLGDDRDSDITEVLRLAGAIAWNILNGGTPSAGDYDALRVKIAAHADYSQYAAVSAGFNGISASA